MVYKSSVCGGEVVMSVDECGTGVAPIFDVGVAGEKERADALADEADGSFGDAVELMHVCGCERAGDGGGVAEFKEPRGDGFATVVGVYAFDCAVADCAACVADVFEIG